MVSAGQGRILRRRGRQDLGPEGQHGCPARHRDSRRVHRRLKSALTGDPAARFVYVNNFEVERCWGQGEPRLPGTGLSFSAATVNRIEEVGVLLADEDDAVVLKARRTPGTPPTWPLGLGAAAAGRRDAACRTGP